MFRNVKIAKKIPIAIAVFIIIPIVITIIALNSARTINQGGIEIHDNYLPSIIHLTEARKQVYEEFIWLKSHIISPNDQAMLLAEQKIAESEQALNKALNRFAVTLDVGDETRIYNEFKSKLAKLKTLRQNIIQLSQTNNDVEADRIANNEYRQLFIAIQEQIQAMFATNVDGAEDFFVSNQSTYDSSVTVLIITVVIAASIAILIGWVFITGVRNPLTSASEKVIEISDNKDLKLQLNTDGHDEISDLSSKFNGLINSLKSLINEVQQSNTVLNSESASLQETIENASRNLNSSSEMLDGVQYSTSEITDSIDEIARSAAQASTEAEQSSQEAESGMQLQQQTISSVESLKTNMHTASEAVEGLSRDSNAIGSVLDVIKGIAEQTNLLALNAAIEAARAGEQGRGFAVVADEVRSLAQRTQESTAEIQTMIEKLQAGAESSVSAMQQSVHSLDATAELTVKTEGSLQNIVSIINNISLMNDQIASATEQQSVAVKEISDNVNTANQLSQRSAQAFENIKSSSDQLTQVVQNSEALTAQFKL